MSAAMDVDRLLAEWLEDAGPDMLRIGVVADALDEARRTRQRRLAIPVIGVRPWPRDRTGDAWRSMAIVLALVALVVSSVALLASGALPVPLGPVTPPVPATNDASPSAEAIEPATALPAAMAGTWIAAQPATMSFGTPSGPAQLSLVIDGTLSARTSASPASRLFGSTATTAGDGLPLVLTADGVPPQPDWLQLAVRQAPFAWCEAGARGEYAWAFRQLLTDDDVRADVLQLTVIRDDCAARAQVLSRAWVRSLVPVTPPASGGRGVIPVSAFVLGATLPAGDYTAEGGQSGTRVLDAGATTGIGVWADPLVITDPCDAIGATADPAPDAAAFIARLARNPGLSVVSTADAVVAGRAATEVVIDVVPALTCPDANGSGTPIEPTAAWAWQTGPSWALPRSTPSTIYLVAMPDHLLVIEVRAPDDATRQALLESISIGSSFTGTISG